jgi:ribosome-associated toxin RatA of RatAB toxin-antitoxin module
MQRRLPTGSYSEAKRKLAEPGFAFLNLRLRLLTAPRIELKSLLLLLVTISVSEGASVLASDAGGAAGKTANPSAIKTQGKTTKGLIAHLASPALADDNQKENKDGKNSKDAKDESQYKEGAEETIKENNIYARQYFNKIRESRTRKYSHSSSTVQIYAPRQVVWKVLTDFEKYPEIFKRIDTCHITKREHGLLFAESYLKPQMFVKKLCQHTVTDTSQGPNFLQWKMLDGNFSSVYGSWTLSDSQDKKGKPVCSATYELEADPGPIIPSAMVSFLLHQIEHEVVTSFKKACEKNSVELSEKGK